MAARGGFGGDAAARAANNAGAALKRGPFLWEHQLVHEDCTNCHNPHSSQNARLLKETVPFLCLDCHAATNGMGGEGLTKSAIRAAAAIKF